MYSGLDDGPVYRSRFDRSPRRSVRRIYDLKTIDLANTPTGARRSASWSRLPSSRFSSGYSNNYRGGYGNGYTSGYGDSGGSNYNFGNHLHTSASSREVGPEGLRRSWTRPFGSSFMAEAEADLNVMSHARSRLYKMADDALTVLNAIREGFTSGFEPRSRRWADDFMETCVDDDIPTSRSYRSPIVMEDCFKRNRPRWSTLIDDGDSAMFGSNLSVSSLRRSPMPSTAEILARVETPTDFPPFRYGGRLASDDWSFSRTDPTRSYREDKPKDLDGLRNARRQYFENQQQQCDAENSGTERTVPIVIDDQKSSDRANPPSVRIDEPTSTAPPATKAPPVEESESHFAPAPASAPASVPAPGPTSTHNKDDAKQSGRDDSYTVNVLQTAPTSEPDVSVFIADDTMLRLTKLEEENGRLRDLVHNVTEINKRWQKFNSEREVYVSELKATIDQQQDQLNQCLELLRLAKAGQMHSENGRTQNGTSTTTSYEHLRERLREIIEPKATEAELTKLQEEVSRLQRRLEETKREHSELVGAFPQVKTQNSGCEVSEVTVQNEGQTTLNRPASEESIPTLDNITKAAKYENIATAKTNFAISNSSTSNTIVQEDIQQARMTPSPCRDIETPTEDKHESNLADRRNVSENDKNLFKYAFDSASLRNWQEDVYGRGHDSPADGLSPTPTPVPGATRYVPLEVSASCSSIASIAPVVSIPPSSRDSSVDRDISICSDATIDCSPPTPVPVTVGFDSDGLATVTTFRTVPIVRESTPDHQSDAGSDGSNKSTIEVKPPEVPVRGPSTFLEEETVCSLTSPKGILARTTSTHGSAVDSEGNGTRWNSDIFSRGLSTDTVSCPKCGNTYPPSKYMQLMMHLDNCRTATGSPSVSLQELARNAINHIMNS